MPRKSVKATPRGRAEPERKRLPPKELAELVRALRVGTQLDVFDTSAEPPCWQIGRVCRLNPASVFIHYEGWPTQFDEEISASYYAYRLAPLNRHTAKADGHDSSCFHCKQGGDNLLLCDGCHRVAHLHCVNLRSVPSGDWFCPQCIHKHRTGKKGTAGRDGRQVEAVEDHGGEEDDATDDEGLDARGRPKGRGAVKVTQRATSRPTSSFPRIAGRALSPLLVSRHALATKTGGAKAWRPGHVEIEELEPDEPMREAVEEKQQLSRMKRRREEPASSPPPAASRPARPLWTNMATSNVEVASYPPPPAASFFSSPSSSSSPPPSVSDALLVTGVPTAPSSSTRRRVGPPRPSSSAATDTPLSPPSAALAELPQPSMTCFLDCYQFAFDQAHKPATLPSPTSSSSSSAPSDQGTPANIPTFSFPHICLLHDHRSLLLDFCRLVDADLSKPPMAIIHKLSTPGIERWRMLVDRLLDYRQFLERKINERMNRSNEERVEMGKRKEMTERGWKEVQARVVVEEEEAREVRRKREVTKADLAVVIEAKRQELRRVQEQMRLLEVAEAKLVEPERAAAEERKDRVRQWVEKLRGVEEEAGKITTSLNVLQALRDHVRETRKEGADDRAGPATLDRPPWEPFHTVLTRLRKLEQDEVKRKERASPLKEEYKEQPPYPDEELKVAPGADDGLADGPSAVVPSSSHSSTTGPSVSPVSSAVRAVDAAADLEMDEDAGLAYQESKYDSEGGDGDGSLVTEVLDDEGMDVASVLHSLPSLASPASSSTSSLSITSSATLCPPLTPPDTVTSTQTTTLLTQSQQEVGKVVPSATDSEEATAEGSGSVEDAEPLSHLLHTEPHSEAQASSQQPTWP